MENEEQSQDLDQNKIINNDYKNDIQVRLAFNYKIKIKISEKMSLSELKNEIRKNYFISDDEYEILIGEKNINKESNNTTVFKLFEKYKSNDINIKTNKNIFDLQNQLNIYDNFLTKKISLKSDEINFLSKEIENLKNDLNSI